MIKSVTEDVTASGQLHLTSNLQYFQEKIYKEK